MELVPGTRVKLAAEPLIAEDEFKGEYQGEVRFRRGAVDVCIHWDDEDITWEDADKIEIDESYR